MLIRKIYRDPNSDASGAASAASTPAAASSSSPAGGAASSAAGASPFENFGSSLRQALTGTPDPSQPPSDGKKDGAAATAPEGEDGEDQTEDPGTTANPEDDTAEGEEQEGADKGWSKEEQALLKAKGWELPFDAKNKAVLDSYRDLESQFGKVSGSNANAIQRVQALEAALYAGDAKALQDLGFDLKLDQRTPENQLAEIEEQFNGVKSAFEPVLKQLQGTDAYQAVFNAAKGYLSGLEQKAQLLAKEMEKQEWKQEVLRETGKTPAKPTDIYKQMTAKAESNLTALTQEDPKAAERYQLLVEATKPGGPLHALGITLAKAYGTSLETARYFDTVAKGLHFEKNMKTILASERRKWEKDAAKRAVTGRARGESPSSNPNNAAPNAASRLSAGMRSFMGQSV